ncbi:hypothetical protein MKQ68_24595 [Chitinophaga horti]|uniref:Uncharacterized protein n=1 Tax=Chitinophaga horti TaxID=2920382 RepID=A0ABY6J4M9_9BACT|nr:hypothetical protein [Chitinophaga horti]UYQ93266.1 hypothetical protein MKQ68_24595 [Chitinophaga horti]
MKRFLSFFLMLTTVATIANAQSAQYQETMEQQIGEMYKNQQSGGLAQSANTFDRIAEAEKTQWLPYYYAAYCRVMQALDAQGSNAIDAFADQAEKSIEKAEALSKDNAEIACLKSLITTARINADPMTRGRKLSPVAARYLSDAKKYDAENPRIYLLEGQSLFYTPEQFGGSKVKAKEKFELSLKKFDAFKPASSLAPNWGKEYTESLLSKIGR